MSGNLLFLGDSGPAPRVESWSFRRGSAGSLAEPFEARLGPLDDLSDLDLVGESVELPVEFRLEDLGSSGKSRAGELGKVEVWAPRRLEPGSQGQ